MKNILALIVLVLMVGCDIAVQPKYKVGDIVVTKIDNRKGIIKVATGSIYKNNYPFYIVRFAARVEDNTTTHLYEEVGVDEYEIELYKPNNK